MGDLHAVCQQNLDVANNLKVSEYQSYMLDLIKKQKQNDENYTVDSETGESIILNEIEKSNENREKETLSTDNIVLKTNMLMQLLESNSNDIDILHQLSQKNSHNTKSQFVLKNSRSETYGDTDENVPYTPCEGAVDSQIWPKSPPSSHILTNALLQDNDQSNSTSSHSSSSSISSSTGNSKFTNCSNYSTRSKDEKRARNLKIPLTIAQIINSPSDEFINLLSINTLTTQQLQLIKDIRRRGKNKLAAKSCRKRKMNEMEELNMEINCLKEECKKLYCINKDLQSDINECEKNVHQVFKSVFHLLPKPAGDENNFEAYTLEQTKDGRLFLVPK